MNTYSWEAKPGAEVKSVERTRRKADREDAQNLGEYYTLIISLIVLGLSVFISTAVLSAPISQFVGTIEKTIAIAGGK